MGWSFYNSSGQLLTAPASTGTSDLATEATNVTVTANDSEDANIFPVFVDGASGTQGIETDSGFTYNPSSGMLVIAGELDAGSLDISGSADIDGTMEADAITVDGTTLAEYIADTVGAMVSSNTETNIAVSYQDGDNTLDFVVASDLNTTGNAGTVTTNANLTGHVTSTGNGAVLGTFSSAQLRTALSDETGSGVAVFATSPTLVTPALGTPASGDLSNCTGAGVGLGLVIALS